MISPSGTVLADIDARVAAYRAGRDPFNDLDATLDAISAHGERPVWISLVSREQTKEWLAQAQARFNAGEDLPLYGIPFAIKDNMNLAGMPTTVGCPAFAFVPERSATVVDRLMQAGSIPVGKTNMDQFATGLNGTRSPYGIPASALDPAYVAGGSSSGSAVAVSKGLVPFALATDTAGSGRVPAAFNNIVGLKPTKGIISNRGVFPACRTLDAVSIFACTVRNALTVARVATAFDEEEPYSRRCDDTIWSYQLPRRFRFGRLDSDVLARCSPEVLETYLRSAAALETSGGVPVRFDHSLFEEAGALIYNGPWVAERLAAIRDFATSHSAEINPVVSEIILSAERISAVDCFTAHYQLAALLRRMEAVWASLDFLLLPVTMEHPKIADMLASPLKLNARLGYFTNSTNLLDLSANSIPCGISGRGLPIGMMLVGPAFADGLLAQVGDLLHRSNAKSKLGATALSLDSTSSVSSR